MDKALKTMMKLEKHQTHTTRAHTCIDTKFLSDRDTTDLDTKADPE